MNRRDFGRLLALSGAVPFLTPGFEWPAPLDAAPAASGDEAAWAKVRAQFLMPDDLAVLNAANLCPSSAPALEALYNATRDVDRDPSMDNRAKLGEARERTREQLAAFLRVTPEEIVITRNTSESNNLVSTGIDLKAGDEVLLSSDNHPSNHTAWQQKAKRFGFSVVEVPTPNPHPGPEHYIEAFGRAITPRTKVVGITHLTSTVGDLFPAKEICRLARERGVLTLVDGAQSFGLIDVDLADMQPDFYSGSAHKWACGPKENGVLYINRAAQPKIWASIYSAYPGRVGISKTFEGFGQRDEPAMVAFGEALALQTRVGRPAIEQRARELTTRLYDGLARIDGVAIWTSRDPARRAAVLSFQPGTLDARRLAAALYRTDRIACATRGGQDRPGIRFSPHFYNTPAEIDRAVAAVKHYVAAGV
ncbi:MAG TPA: aminotransferase class V-fold PLP-dependent enzyme [Vicinamibacterales bacterium]|jgi:selenocysteine lyase/cysteine desulfurase|nr:aminotransferase class V-fold PLP-dependent enzyme [Vicinamibacterales bacterium]